ncbi:MAG: DUF790 family protein [Chloroflexi bacterium]|nr:DUF790 family protein [Chloroflexota bacterium]
MRFSLQDVKKSIQRRSGELSVSLNFLRPGELHREIEQLITYHESLLGQPQRQFSLDEARSCIGDYRLAHCLIAALSNWYSWRQREWMSALQEISGSPDLGDLTSPVQLRLALYSYVNERYQGFLDTQTRMEGLQEFSALYHLTVPDLEYLLVLDSEEEALLIRDAAQPPSVQEVTTLYNQWVFEAALFNASSVRFAIDCNAFANIAGNNTQARMDQFTATTVSVGVGAAIKRLCYLARRLGVYYDLAYEPSLLDQITPPLLTLTLYGPQEVTGAPQQYGLRLARLCRMLLDYGVSKTEHGRTKKKASLATAIVEAEATVHFLQRSYNFVMDAHLLQLLPPTVETQRGNGRIEADASALFDSSIEQSFSEAFVALAGSQGVDGWRLEREPEPLLLDHSIFIPDFALTRAQRRIYVEILGFWTPAYRERKIQKLQQLQGRDDLLLAIPVEAQDAFASIAADFPIVSYDGQLSVTEVLHVLRSRYDDFTERLERIDVDAVRIRVRQEGLLPEQVCYEVLHCYRRSEVQRAAERIVGDDIAFVPGIGLYSLDWLVQLQHSFIEWLRAVRSATLSDGLREVRRRLPAQLDCEDATIEALLGLWPEVYIRRSSIFDAVVELVGDTQYAEDSAYSQEMSSEKAVKKQVRERRVVSKKRIVGEEKPTQGDLWG